MKLGTVDPVLRFELRVDERQQRFAHFLVARRDVERRHLGAGDGVAEDADDARAHRVGELVEAEVVVGAGDFLQEALRLDHLEVVGAEGAQADDAEVLVAHHDRVRRAPLVAGEQPRVDEVDVGLERRLEAVLPALEAGQDRDVVGGQRVLAGAERVAELAQVDELRRLRFADDELRAVLDLLVVVGETPADGVARVVGPLDDVDELCLDVVHQAHGLCASRNRPILLSSQALERARGVGIATPCGVAVPAPRLVEAPGHAAAGFIRFAEPQLRHGVALGGRLEPPRDGLDRVGGNAASRGVGVAQVVLGQRVARGGGLA